MKIKRIAIVGAGTAGWLAANHLGCELSCDPEIEITVIESKEVPTIGVGEGTVPYIMKALKRFGISEAELLLTCDATFKQGIKFVNWLDDTAHGKNNYYYHPFDVPYPGGFDISPYWLTQAHTRPYDDVGIQARICELGLAPKRKSSKEYEGDLAYAYHFNAVKFAQLLAKNATNRFNVKHKFATITDVIKDEQGMITQLHSSEGDSLAYDFYIDCSGFSSILIDKALAVPFISKADELYTDSVFVQQVPLSEEQQINPYTTATAHKAGWIWDIPLTTRRGTGFVFSSKHMSDEEALTLYAEYLGVEVNTLNPRKLDMKIGYREQFWCKNCVGLGLAQGFVEPLEATSILLSDFSAEILARNFPRDTDDFDICAPYYNKVVTYAWERVVDFIKLHYCISDRTDSQFWLDNKNPDSISSELKELLNKFKLRTPHQTDFFSRFDLFNEKNFLYVLYGMQYKTRQPKLTDIESKKSKELMLSNDELVKQGQKYLIEQREWFQALWSAVGK